MSIARFPVNLKPEKGKKATIPCESEAVSLSGTDDCHKRFDSQSFSCYNFETGRSDHEDESGKDGRRTGETRLDCEVETAPGRTCVQLGDRHRMS